MVGEEDKDRPLCLGGDSRRTYSRSVSWTDRSPTKAAGSKPQWNSKARACLPPLQPLRVSRPKTEEWPTAGSDDLGVWGNPATPGVRGRPVGEVGNLELEKPMREFEFNKDKVAFFDKECSRIADHLYLGSDAVAKDREILLKNGITHVLNCVGFVCPEYYKKDFVYKTLWLRDSPSEDITSILYDVFDYFEEVRERKGRVLVHCCQGVSRSTSLVIAYLMWKEGQSFEVAFQYVKAARGVTNPNMGFACQLFQIQKRVHAVPASPNSVLKMYRMAPHSSYAPLHLVPKMLSQPKESALDSRGAFIVHIPSAVYVWVGSKCSSVMSGSASVAASQVIRYEKAIGPALTVREGEEPPEFWNALGIEESIVDSGVGQRKVDDYDMDFNIFNKAVAGGVVPPLEMSEDGSETHLPARENGWGKLRQKITCGAIKEFITLSKLSCGSRNLPMDICEEIDYPVSPSDPSLHSSPQRDSFDSFSSFSASPKCIDSSSKEVSSPEYGSPDSFSCFLVQGQNFGTSSPLLSPSTSDYSNSFTFSPSSSNWSDLSYLSAQPSPSGLERTVIGETACLVCKETSSPTEETFSDDHSSRASFTCLSCTGISPSIAERRGNPPPLMKQPTVDEIRQVPKNLVRSWSFSLTNLEDHIMTDVEVESLYEEPFSPVTVVQNEAQSASLDEAYYDASQSPSCGTTNAVVDVAGLALYRWPGFDKVEVDGCGFPDSRSVYVTSLPNVSSDTNHRDVVYVWLGRDVSCEEGQSPSVSEDSSCNDRLVQWETVGRSFITQKGLATSSLVQVVREGEEPEQLWKHLNCFSFQNPSQRPHD